MLLIDDYLLPAMMSHWLLSPRTPIQEMLVTLSSAARFIALLPFCHVRAVQAVPETLPETSMHTVPEAGVRGLVFMALFPICRDL